ncbi:MAG TPA: hypothetical protein VFZ25_05950 [Chloroflexota bacterium]|nr:hypothetical protein [Chloroflexota bacterium]
MADRASRSGAFSLKDLRARVRASRALDADLKRRWLAMLPHLSAAERARLAEILARETAGRGEP